MDYLAHKYSDRKPQSMREHTHGVTTVALDIMSRMTVSNSLKDCVKCACILHDSGKYSDAFQLYIRNQKKKSIETNHSGIGAAICVKHGLQYCAFIVAAHHSQLPTLVQIQKITKQYSNPKVLPITEEIVERFSTDNAQYYKHILSTQQTELFTALEIRYALSLLVSADHLDTSGSTFTPTKPLDYDGILSKIDNKLQLLSENTSTINTVRKQIQDNIKTFKHTDNGLYSLCLPTGSGKTISSLMFAIEHAKQRKLPRIIYVSPYRSILHQTLRVFSDFIGADNILPHFDSLTPNSNWSHNPIILTSCVQFFDSIFDNTPKKLKKIHNISDSVIIVDEPQLLPFSLGDAIHDMLKEISEKFNNTIVYCSATMPSWAQTAKPILDTKPEYITPFRRVKVTYKKYDKSSDLFDKILQNKQTLTVVNVKKTALKFYESLSGENVIYITTTMCPHHIKQKIEHIKQLLSEKKPLHVVSTQMMECGIDVDFPVVFREIAPLDNIVQCAGRCNREGRITIGEFEVFEIEGELSLPKVRKDKEDKEGRDDTSYAKGTELSRDMFEPTNTLDIYDSGTLKEYYMRLEFKMSGVKDSTHIKQYESELEFGKTRKKFKIIEDTKISVVVDNYNNEKLKKLLSMLDKLKDWKDLKNEKKRKVHKAILAKIKRHLAPFSVNVFQYEFNKMLSLGLLITDKWGIYHYEGNYGDTGVSLDKIQTVI